jgi:hypothetical protein
MVALLMGETLLLKKKNVLIPCLIFIGICALSCSNKTVDNYQRETKMAARTIEEVINEHTQELMSIPGVVGVGRGLCNNNPCIKVYIIKKTPDLDKKIPNVLDGYKVMIEVTGKIQAHPEN